MIQTEGSQRVVVIGGGLAGISAAVRLAEAGLPVTVLEARPWLGGATCSFARRGLTIDNGQHAFLRCFTAYRDLLAKLGVADSCAIQDRLDLVVFGPDARARIRRSALPAPFQLARALAGYPMLSPVERAKVAAAAVLLQFSELPGGRADISLGSWLSGHGQKEHSRRMFWDVLTVPLLNVAGDDADLGLAATAIRTTVLAGREAADIGVPTIPLSRLHSGPAASVLARLGAEVLLGVRADAVRAASGGRYQVRLAEAGQVRRGGSHQPDVIDAAGVVIAVPPWEAAELAPAGLHEAASRWAQLQPSPVVSIHVVYGRQVTDLPFAAATGSPIRWVIDKTQAAGLRAGQYLAATVPAAAAYVDKPAARLQDELRPALEQLLPAAADADVEDFFVTRERRATIAQVAGSRSLRAGPGTGPGGVAVAGAWTDTGWPDTMEGAVRSGRAAAQKLIAELAGIRGTVVSQPAASSDDDGNGVPHQDELPGMAELAATAQAATGSSQLDSANALSVPATGR